MLKAEPEASADASICKTVHAQRTKQWQPLTFSIPSIPISVLKKGKEKSSAALSIPFAIWIIFHAIAKYSLVLSFLMLFSVSGYLNSYGHS